MAFYDFEIKKPNGEVMKMEAYKGQPVLVVNTATKCGLAPQFKGLERLHKEYGAKGLVVLGLPCSQFMGQEPESNETVEKACEINFGVTFQLTEKVNVNGPDAHPLIKYLRKEKKGFLNDKIKWNFTKFLVSPEGKVMKRFSPTTKPEHIEKYIKKMVK